MKTTILAATLISILSVTTVIAATDNEAVKQRVEQVKSEFNLNDQQAKRLEKILTRAGMSKAEKRAARAEKRREHRLARMKEKLGLSDEQASQIKAIMVQQHEQMKALREQGKANIAAILTPEQAAKAKEMRAHRQERRSRHHGHRDGGHHRKHKRGGHGGGRCDYH